MVARFLALMRFCLCLDRQCVLCMFFFFNDTATTEIYTLSLHDALPISQDAAVWNGSGFWENISLHPSQKFDESYPVNYDKGHAFITTPNPMSDTDWLGWLYLRAYNKVEVQDTSGL